MDERKAAILAGFFANKSQREHLVDRLVTLAKVLPKDTRAIICIGDDITVGDLVGRKSDEPYDETTIRRRLNRIV